jgi:chemotaxis protein methyltransferase CheR
MEMTPLAARSLAGLLEQRTGQQLAAGRRWRLETALGPVLKRFDLDSLDHLAGLCSTGTNPDLTDEVVEALLNHETSFYRDLVVFRGLARDALPRLAAARQRDRRLRIWSAGCSTGQEAYSMAMLFDAQRPEWRGWDVEIIGTDVSPQAIAQARAGLYSQFEAQRGLPITELIANFDAENEAWRLKSGLRDRVRFATHNLFDPAPAGRFDLILCRNVLLYFVAERSAKVLERLWSAIAPDGLLMLGAGETVLGLTDRFEPDPVTKGLYRPRP